MKQMTDEALENRIGNLLRAGVLSAAVCVLVGAVLYLSAHARDLVHFSTFKEPPAEFRSISGIFGGATRFQSEAVIQLGVLFLISTPIARVVLAMIGFYLERDRLYTIVSAIVLAILLFSLSHGS